MSEPRAATGSFWARLVAVLGAIAVVIGANTALIGAINDATWLPFSTRAGATPTATATATITRPGARVVATFSASGRPDGIAIDTSLDRIFVVSGEENRVRAFRSRGEVLTETDVPEHPVDAAADPGLGRIYVKQLDLDSIAVLESLTGRLVGSVRVGRAPSAVAVDLVTHRVYVANSNSNDVTIVDPTNLRVIKTVPVEANPIAVVLNPRTGLAYVANYGAQSITVVNTASTEVQGRMSLPTGPARLAVDVTGNRLLCE